MPPGGLGVKTVESVDGPSAVHARQSDMPDYHEVLMFFYLVKKAPWILPHGKDNGHLAPLVPIH